MLKIVGNDIWRGGMKIGFIEAERIYNHDGQKTGYFSGNDIYNVSGRKLGYLRGDLLETVDGESLRLEDIRERVNGGTVSDITRATIFLVLGD